MQSLRNSLAWRLAIWFLLLSLLPVGVILVFVRQGVHDTFTDLVKNDTRSQAKLLAAQIASLNDPQATQALLAESSDAGHLAFVIDQQGLYAGHPDAAKLTRPARDDFPSKVIEQVLQGEDQGVIIDEMTGRLFAYAAVPAKGESLVIAVDSTVISTPLWRIERTSFVQLAVSLLIVSVAGGIAIFFVLGPIRQLTRAAEKIGAGHLQAEVEASDMEGELRVLTIAFNQMTGQLRDSYALLEQRVAERTAQLQAAADIGRATTSVRDLDELLRLALQLIRERFGFYHASVFLMDKAGEFAVLRESTGEVGAQLKARGHRLGVGSHSLIGWVTQSLKPRVALDTAEDPYHFKNPLLPETRSELAIPLLIGDRLLGALDVQSTALNAFSESDVQVLQTLADQLSVAIQNAELFQSTQTTLAEVSSLYQQMTGTAWRSLLQGRAREMIFELQPDTGELPPAEGSASIEIPLRLRGEVVGSLELHGRPPGEMGVEEQAVLETVAAQLSVALESAALFEEAQRHNRREQLISAITDQMRSTLNPATILQSGIRGLGQALGATEVIVKLAPTAPTPSGGRPEG